MQYHFKCPKKFQHIYELDYSIRQKCAFSSHPIIFIFHLVRQPKKAREKKAPSILKLWHLRQDDYHLDIPPTNEMENFLAIITTLMSQSFTFKRWQSTKFHLRITFSMSISRSPESNTVLEIERINVCVTAIKLHTYYLTQQQHHLFLFYLPLRMFVVMITKRSVRAFKYRNSLCCLSFPPFILWAASNFSSSSYSSYFAIHVLIIIVVCEKCCHVRNSLSMFIRVRVNGVCIAVAICCLFLPHRIFF